MKSNSHIWSYHAQFFLEWKMFQKNIVKKINLQSVSDRVDLSVYIVKVFYTIVEMIKDAHPWPVYRPVHKSGCCEKKTPTTHKKYHLQT
jgi:hypothetical protein